jgi:hypothetical protein
MGVFSAPPCPDLLWGPTIPPVQWYHRLKRLGPEADHSTPSSFEVKNAWSYTSTFPLCFHGVVLRTGTNLPSGFLGIYKESIPRLPAILTEILLDFTHSLQANASTSNTP